MLLRFTKMHGLGNDLMVLDLISQYAYIQPQQMRAWSDRRYGVGFRRLALIEVPKWTGSPVTSVAWRVWSPISV